MVPTDIFSRLSLNGEYLSSTVYLLPIIYPILSFVDPDPQSSWIWIQIWIRTRIHNTDLQLQNFVLYKLLTVGGDRCSKENQSGSQDFSSEEKIVEICSRSSHHSEDLPRVREPFRSENTFYSASI